MSKRFERFVKGSAFIERCNGNIPYSEIISRLSKLEDIMEENDCLTPEELKEKIESLAEKDKEIDKLTSKLEQANEIINNPDTLIFQQQELIDNLQKTIEEKNKEIERLNACVDFYKSYYISFKEKVIDELEKVRDYISDSPYIKEPEYTRVCNFIRQQINELKGEAEDE